MPAMFGTGFQRSKSMPHFDSYRASFPNARLTRSKTGVLEVALHTNGDTLVFNGHTHGGFNKSFLSVYGLVLGVVADKEWDAIRAAMRSTHRAKTATHERLSCAQMLTVERKPCRVVAVSPRSPRDCPNPPIMLRRL